MNRNIFLENIYYSMITMNKVYTPRHTRKDDKAYFTSMKHNPDTGEGKLPSTARELDLLIDAS